MIKAIVNFLGIFGIVLTEMYYCVTMSPEDYEKRQTEKFEAEIESLVKNGEKFDPEVELAV